MEVPVYHQGTKCGTLWAERRGLYMVFRAEVETEEISRIRAVFEGGETVLGIPAPEQGRMTLRISVPANRLPGGRLLRGVLIAKESSDWRHYPGGNHGKLRLPPGRVRGQIYQFPWRPGERLPCEELLCFFRFVQENQGSFLELRLDEQGNPVHKLQPDGENQSKT